MRRTKMFRNIGLTGHKQAHSIIIDIKIEAYRSEEL